MARIGIKVPPKCGKSQTKKAEGPFQALPLIFCSDVQNTPSSQNTSDRFKAPSPLSNLVMFRFDFDIGPAEALEDSSDDVGEPSDPSTAPDLPQSNNDLEGCNEILIQDLVWKKFAKGGYWVTRTASYASFQGNRHSPHHRALG